MKHKFYDKAFKEHAVQLWLGSGKSAQEVADELGIKRDRLYTWKQELETAVPAGQAAGRPGPSSRSELERQLARLQRENQMLRQQRDILKKTLGILSEVPNNDSSGSTR
jgi:transposase